MTNAPRVNDPIAEAIRCLSNPASSQEQLQAAGDCLLALAPEVVHVRLERAVAASRLARRPGQFGYLYEVAEEIAIAARRSEEVRRREEEAREASSREAALRGLAILLSREATCVQREAAELDLAVAPLGFVQEAVVQVLAGLDGPWRVVQPGAEAAARKRLGRWLERHSRLAGVRVQLHLPSIEHPVAVRGAERTGELRASYGLGLYDLHQEWPVNGFGVPKDELDVLVPGRPAEPLLEWLRREGIRVLCPRCGGVLDRGVEIGCPAGRRARQPS